MLKVPVNRIECSDTDMLHDAMRRREQRSCKDSLSNVMMGLMNGVSAKVSIRQDPKLSLQAPNSPLPSAVVPVRPSMEQHPFP